jgi:hypothetical protein
MNTQENNKLIAEFLGKDHELNQCIAAPNFHKSWDWLMPVVERINNILDDDDEFVYSVNIHPSKVTIYFYQRDVFVSNEHGSTMKEMLYLSVVEFINQLNK